MAILDKIFSIKEYNETTNVITVFGIRIKLLKKQYANALKQNPFDKYRKKNVDITTIPPATGQLRDIQLANLALLKELDYVCKQSGLKYWLDSGTLIGALRHKGFIPWDDDIDVGMMREDYKKVEEAFLKYSRNSDIYAENTYLGRGQSLIKIKHKKCKYVFVDVFPYDFLNKILSEKERIDLTKSMREQRKLWNKNSSLSDCEKVNNAVQEYYASLISDEKIENSDIIYGQEYSYNAPIWVHSYSEFFPLKEISFEGFSAMCINCPEEHIIADYGDYMSYPKKIGLGHSAYAIIPKEQFQIIEQLKKQGNS